MRSLRIAHRVILAVPVALGVAVLAFFSLHLLPGDPVQIMLGDTDASAATIRAVQHELHLDRPLHVQLALFFAQLARGDLGTSIVQRRPVAALIGDALPATIELTAAALVIAIVIAVPRVTGFVLIDGVLARNAAAVGSALRHLVLPALTLGVVVAAVLARTVRASMIEVLQRRYVTTARAKGLPETAVVVKHALRNALIPALTVIGLQIGELLGGNMIVETVFAWPGLGRLVVNSIFARDYLVVQAAVMLYAVTYVAANLAVDVAYTMLDPQVEAT